MSAKFTLARFAKFVTAAAGAASVLAAQGLLAGQAENWTTGVLSALTAALVLLVPNAPAQPQLSADIRRDLARQGLAADVRKARGPLPEPPRGPAGQARGREEKTLHSPGAHRKQPEDE